MARITKRLCLQVGEFHKEGMDKPQREYRDIGVMLEFEKDGNTWNEIKLNADILSPVLFQLVKPLMQKGTASTWVKLFDVARKTTDKTAPGSAPEDALDADPPF